MSGLLVSVLAVTSAGSVDLGLSLEGVSSMRSGITTR